MRSLLHPLRLLFRPVGIQDFLVLAATVGLLTVQLDNFAADPGVGWHLATGRAVILEQAVPRIDPFLYSPSPRPWVSDQWLSDVFLYAGYLAGSWPLLYSALSAIFLVTFFGLVYCTVEGETKNRLGASIASLFAFKGAQIHFLLRPSMLGFFLFSLLYLLLYRARRSEALRSKLPLLLPPIFVLWANLHPSFVLGLLLVAILPASELCRMVLGGETVGSLSALKRTLLLFALSVGATLVNPYGGALHQSILALGSSHFFMEFHSEWHSPNFKALEGLLMELAIASLFLAAVLPLRKRLSLSAGEVLSLLVFGHLALQMIRILPYFMIAASVPLVRSWSALGADLFERAPVLGRAVGRLQALEARALGGGRALLFVIVAIFASALANGAIPLYHGSLGFADTHIPVRAIETLRDRAVSSGERARVAASPDFGGAITFIGHGALEPLIDDRNTLLGEKFYREFLDHMKPSLSAPREWRQFFISLGATHLMLGVTSPLAVIAVEQGEVKEVYRDAKVVIFELA